MVRPALLSAVLALLALAGAASARGADFPGRTVDPSVQHFLSRPDLLPPAVRITTPARDTAPGYVFVAPKKHAVQAGPLILDDAGQVVWFRPLDTHGVTDFRVQRYRGEPVLTWWRGRATQGVGTGYYVIMDRSYREIAEVHAGNGLVGDVHEFLITPRDTALITVYHRMDYDLSPVGGPRDGSIYEGVVQELDIATGRVLFEWHSIDHVGIEESYSQPPPPEQGAAAAPYDYFHLNSIDPEPDGNLLISARNTHALYEIDRRTKRVRWRLGGKKSDFAMGQGTSFAWQHDARRRSGDTITLFDNGANPPVEEHSRPLVLHLDLQRRTVTLVRAYANPDGLLSGSQGNLQLLPNGNAFVGWGANPYFTEYDRAGRVLFDGHLEGEGDSYRAYRNTWEGRPGDRPALAARYGAGGRIEVYASWNGATPVRSWEVLAGAPGARLRVIATAPKDGFETQVAAPAAGDEVCVAVRALGAGGEQLGLSRPVRTRPFDLVRTEPAAPAAGALSATDPGARAPFAPGRCVA